MDGQFLWFYRMAVCAGQLSVAWTNWHPQFKGIIFYFNSWFQAHIRGREQGDGKLLNSQQPVNREKGKSVRGRKQESDTIPKVVSSQPTSSNKGYLLRAHSTMNASVDKSIDKLVPSQPKHLYRSFLAQSVDNEDLLLHGARELWWEEEGFRDFKSSPVWLQEGPLEGYSLHRPWTVTGRWGDFSTSSSKWLHHPVRPEIIFLNLAFKLWNEEEPQDCAEIAEVPQL